MDKRSEQSKDAKECGDDDIGIHKYGLCNVRQQADGLWSHASEEVVGLPLSRLATNCYKKDDKREKVNLEDVLSSGPPVLNISKPKRVF